MEENKELIFEIICDNEDIIKRAINIYIIRHILLILN